MTKNIIGSEASRCGYEQEAIRFRTNQSRLRKGSSDAANRMRILPGVSIQGPAR